MNSGKSRNKLFRSTPRSNLATTVTASQGRVSQSSRAVAIEVPPALPEEDTTTFEAAADSENFSHILNSTLQVSQNDPFEDAATDLSAYLRPIGPKSVSPLYSARWQ